MNNSISKADELITNIFSGIGNSSKEASKIVLLWNEVLFSIKNSKLDASQLVDHSKILDLKNGILVVETDHPGRIQLLQMYKNYIQTGLNKKLSELKIKNIVFRLKKNELNKNKKTTKEIIHEKLIADNIDDDFEIKYPSNNEKTELPDEIKAIFDRMRNN
ncbi:MAG: DciA family protein [Treponemataceae bacterium]|nr:DciA family protein [Treponemataceae bacterium]